MARTPPRRCNSLAGSSAFEALARMFRTSLCRSATVCSMHLAAGPTPEASGLTAKPPKT
jgi:hypothetical protein